jgi:hypothetical protein
MLLRRVMQGETPHEDIFRDVVSALARVSTYEPKKLETALSFRILHTLGYIAPDEGHGAFLDGVLTPELVESITEKDVTMYRNMATRALLESHL